jgi:hypothetical protein
MSRSAAVFGLGQVDPQAFAVRHHRGTSRAYLFFPARAHVAELHAAAQELVARFAGDFTMVSN